jgi:hypothetical protein
LFDPDFALEVLFVDRKGHLIIGCSAFFLEGCCCPDGGVKGDIGQLTIGRSGLDISSPSGLCAGLGSAAAGTAVFFIEGGVDFIGVNCVANLDRITAVPP